MEERTQRYWMGDSPTGPWVQPPDGGILAPKGHYAGRVANWKGQDIYMCWHLPPGGQADWNTTRNPHGKYVVAPLTITPRADGSLACGTFDGWRSLAAGDAASLDSSDATLYRGNPASGWSLQTDTGELDLLSTPGEHEDFYLTGTFLLDAPVGGIGFRLEGDSGSGYFIELEEGSSRVSLQKWLGTTLRWTNRPWFAWHELQRGNLRQPFEPGTPLDLSLISNGPYIEVALDGEVVLATLSGERVTGQLGIWAESGSATLTDATLTPLDRPRHG